MKRFILFVVVILVPTLIILFYSYQKTSGIGSVEPKSFPGWQTTQQTQTDCPAKFQGYPFVYHAQQNCQQMFNSILLVFDIVFLIGIVCLFGLLLHSLRKPLPAGLRQLKLRLVEFKILQYLVGLCGVFLVFGILSGLIRPLGIIVLFLSGLVFGVTCYGLFNKWHQHDLHKQLLKSLKRSVLFFGGLVIFMLVSFGGLLIVHVFNPEFDVQEQFGYLATYIIFTCFAIQVLTTLFRDVLKHVNKPKT